MCPQTPLAKGGGMRKLYDHLALLNANGFAAKGIYSFNGFNVKFGVKDLVVVPEIYGSSLETDLVETQWLGFCQNPYMIDSNVEDLANHPYEFSKTLKAIMVDSEHSRDIIHERYPRHAEIILTHSSGNGRRGRLGPFRYGPWPRSREILYFEWKHKPLMEALFKDLALPLGWSIKCMTGKSDEKIAEMMRTGAIFCAPNYREGLCAPTSEAMISGSWIVGWYGGGTEEYLRDKSCIVEQGNIALLRKALVATCEDIDNDWVSFSNMARLSSEWFQTKYSRAGEIEELLNIMIRFNPK
jgi:hypothetical protein